MIKSLVARAAAVAAACFVGTAFVMPVDAFQKQMTWPISASDEPAMVASLEAAPPECKKEPNSTYVVIMVLAGRQDRMSVMLSYVDRLLATCRVHEVHIWNNTRKQEDSDWVSTLADKPSYTVFNAAPAASTGHRWSGSYLYYGGAPPGTPPPTAIGKEIPDSFRPAWEGAQKDNTVFIKGDDDIVYMDLDKFDCYVRYIRENPQIFIVHANILVNGVTDYYKATMDPDLLERFPVLGTYPHELEKGVFNQQNWSVDEPGFAGAEWRNGSMAFDLHEVFLENPKRFTRKGLHGEECIVYKGPGQQVGQGRLSVNYLGFLWSKSDTIGSLVNPEGKSGDCGDEWALTALATLMPGIVECIYTQFVVSHLSFFTQKEADAALPQYQALLEERQRTWQEQPEPLVSEC